MPRNGSGTYSLPQSPFVAGTTISSSAVNSDFSDIASALTASLPRDGQVGMSGALKTPDGSVTIPSLSFSNETNTGFFRSGAGELSVTILGVLVGTFSATGFSGSSIPISTVVDFAGPFNLVPAKWLMCYGQNVSRTTYADLFAILGGQFGSGDGVTTFGLPDLRGRLTAGKDDMGGTASSRLTTPFLGADPTILGSVGGAQGRTLLAGNLPAYTPSGSVAITDPGHSHTVTITTPGNAFTSTVNQGLDNALGGIKGYSAISGVAAGNFTGITGGFTGFAQGGTSAAFSIVQPSMVLNKIIYAGV